MAAWAQGTVQLAEHVGQQRAVRALVVHGLDLVLADAPAGPELPVWLFSHLLGECGTSCFASGHVAAALRKKFPGVLEGAPFLLPGRNAAQRRTLEDWFESHKLRPRIVGEIDDSALVKGPGRGGRAGRTRRFEDVPLLENWDTRVGQAGSTNMTRGRPMSFTAA